MKYRVTMKDPDGVSECLRESVDANKPPGLSEDEWQELRYDRVRRMSSTWFKYDEYLTVEIDDEAGTCIVIKP